MQSISAASPSLPPLSHSGSHSYFGTSAVTVPPSAPATAINGSVPMPSNGSGLTTDCFSVSGGGSVDTCGIRVLSLNIWGLFASEQRRARLAHFGATKVKDYDIICLQEQFSDDDFHWILQHVPDNVRHLLHCRRFPSSFVGSGLTIISRFEILSTQFLCYPTQGYPERVYHGDFFANKGVALTKLRVPTNASPTGHTVIHVYNTHLVAQYQKYSKLGCYEKEIYAPYRISQAYAMANFICNTSRPGDNIILCGDFNAAPSSPEMRLLLGICQLRNGLEFSRTLVEDDSTNFTFTFENQFNTGTPFYHRLIDVQEDIPVQLDHIMFSVGSQLQLAPLLPMKQSDVAQAFQSHCMETPMAAVMFTNNREVVTGDPKCPMCPISDHFGVAARFLLCASPTTTLLGATGPVSSPTLAKRGSISFANTDPDVITQQLSVDSTGHRKSIDFAASFLQRSSAMLALQSDRLFRWAFFMAIIPLSLKLLAMLLHHRSDSSSTASSGSGTTNQGFVLDVIDVLVLICCNSVTLFLGGMAAAILIILSKIQRANDAVLMLNQSEDLWKLLGKPS